MTDPVLAAELAADAFGVAGRLLGLWPTLAEARHLGVPGTHQLVTRRLTPEQELVQAQVIRRDRRAARLAIRDGQTPPGEHPAPARLGPIHARSQVAQAVRTVAGLLDVYVPAAPVQGGGLRVSCRWCAGTGLVQMPAGWVPRRWPTHPPSCGLCGGHGSRCGVCGVAGDCACTGDDAVVVPLLRRVADRLPPLRDLPVAMAAAAELGRAERAARLAVGLIDLDLRVINAPCPACDRRELAADVTSPDRRAWSIACQSKLCRCDGVSCGCNRRVRYTGRRHRWPSWEFYDLAEQLGVSLAKLGLSPAAARR